MWSYMILYDINFCDATTAVGWVYVYTTVCML